MTAILILVALFLLLSLAGIGMSLMELDRRLLDLVKAMEGRYGAWMDQAEKKKKKKNDKSPLKSAPGIAGASPNRP